MIVFSEEEKLTPQHLIETSARIPIHNSEVAGLLGQLKSNIGRCQLKDLSLYLACLYSTLHTAQYHKELPVVKIKEILQELCVITACDFNDQKQFSEMQQRALKLANK